MGLSLIKTTASNVSGSYSPAGLLSGFFDISINGDTTFIAPSAMGDGQLFSVRVTVQGPDTFLCNIAWASNYVGAGNMSMNGTLCGGCSGAYLFLHNGSQDYLFGNIPVS